MEQIKLSKFTLERIKNKEFEKLIPEFYELEKVIENNLWHNNDSVYDHTLTVLEKLGALLKNVKDKISNHLNRKITKYTRKDLLFLAALFHDVGKKETFVKENNKTSCPNHEKVSAKKAKEILSRFDLSEEEKKLVIQIIKYHNAIHLILRSDNNKFDKVFNKTRKKYSNIFWEVILLGMADTLATQPNENTIDEVNSRLSFYKQILF
jgi:putative nucleotidyltransferase with HDIG domain